MIWPEMNFENETNGTKGITEEQYSVKADMELFEWYKKIIRIRTGNETLVSGEFKEIIADDEKDVICYERYNDDFSYFVLINNSRYDYNNFEIETI
jgi:glycosidase